MGITRLATILLILSGCGKSVSDCHWNATEACDNTSLVLQQLDHEVSIYQSAQTPDIRNRSQLRMKFLAEIKSGQEIDRAAEKYSLLEVLIFNEGLDDLNYHPKEQAEVAKTFREFGDLYIQPTPGSGRNRSETIEANSAWAGYWFPARKTELFNGSNSPLAKLDRILSRSGRTGGAAQWEIDNHLPGGESWEGLCFAWAMAAVNLPEPTSPINYNREVLTANDQKALWTKLHQYYPQDLYGVLYRANAETDGTYQDLRPEALHRLLTREFSDGRAVILDDDAGVEVWSKPAYKIQWVTDRDPQYDDRFHVRAFVSIIKQRESFGGGPTTSSDIVMIPLTYTLYINKNRTNSEGSQVIGGVWTGASYESHPDVVWVPKLQATPDTSNPIINQNLEFIRGILRP